MKDKKISNLITTAADRNLVLPDKIAMIGAGAFGTSIARAIGENHPSCSIKLWAYEKEVVDEINIAHINNLYLPGIMLPSNIIAYSDIKETVKECKVVIFATPSKVLYEISSRVRKYIGDNADIAYLTKGFCKIHNRILTMSETLVRVFPSQKTTITAIYGPSHAEEVSKGYHTCLNVASQSENARKQFMNLIACDYLSCRETDDIIGVDLGTTLKNPAAIAAGILSVMPKCGDNLAGALISEALAEMLRFGKAFNAREETIIGIAGLGDLVATALSDHSRNRRFGRDIAKQLLSSGISLNFLDRLIMILKPDYGFEKISEGFNYLAEGIYVIEPILELAEQKKIPMPVYRSLYEVLLNKKDPRLLIETVKDPMKFDQIFKMARVHISGKRKGLENKRGGIFRKTVIKNSLDNLLSDPDFRSEFEVYRTGLFNTAGNIDDKSYGSVFKKNESELFRKIGASNFNKSIERLCSFYFKDISDNFNSVIYKIFIKTLRLFNFLNKLIPGKTGIFENNIKIYGNPGKIRKLKHSNIVYASTYKSYLDFVYINMAIDRYGLYIPRFFIDKNIIDSKIKSFILKLMGGYLIDPGRFSNPVYKEVVQNYIATLVEHGVHILIFPEIEVSGTGKISGINRDFLSRIMDALYKNMEEIALIPVEISHYKMPQKNDAGREDDVFTLKKILNKRIKINFSDPIFVSDLSNSDNIIGLLTDRIINVWKSDSRVYPHYILSSVIRDNNYRLNMEQAADFISESLKKYNYNGRYKEKNILKKGLDFIIKNRIGTVDDSVLSVTMKDEIDYYANLFAN